jgi:hypothetical protein
MTLVSNEPCCPPSLPRDVRAAKVDRWIASQRGG